MSSLASPRSGACAALACLALLAPDARADDARAPASPMNARLMVGLERAEAIAYGAATDDRTYGGERMYPKTGADLVVPWHAGAIPALFAVRAPRLAVDWVEGSTTFGASASVWAGTISRTGSGAIAQIDARVVVAEIAPRLGWLWCDRERLCFWAKAGVTLAYQHEKETLQGRGANGPETLTAGVDDSLVSLNVEPTLLVGLAPHVAVALEGIIDAPLVSSRQVSDGAGITPSDPAPWNLGASIAVYAWF